MLTIRIVAVGKLKEDYWRRAVQEYQKRLSAYCKLELVEVEEFRLGDDPSPAMIQKALQAEGERILKKLLSQGTTVALCIEGRQLTSPQLAQLLEQTALHSSQLNVVIGGSFGLSDAVKGAAQHRISMSPMTFPHQLARVMVCEQLYRGMSINAHAKYHK